MQRNGFRDGPALGIDYFLTDFQRNAPRASYDLEPLPLPRSGKQSKVLIERRGRTRLLAGRVVGVAGVGPGQTPICPERLYPGQRQGHEAFPRSCRMRQPFR